MSVIYFFIIFVLYVSGGVAVLGLSSGVAVLGPSTSTISISDSSSDLVCFCVSAILT
jgi:hypothetical protein